MDWVGCVSCVVWVDCSASAGCVSCVVLESEIATLFFAVRLTMMIQTTTNVIKKISQARIALISIK